MRKLFIALIVGVMAIGIMGCGKKALAEEFKLSEALAKLPPLKQGIAYSLLDNDFNYLSTIELANWKGFTLEAGYSTKDKIVGVVSYEVLKLKDIIDLPILNLVTFNLGGYAGYGRLNMQTLDKSEWDAGISATLINIKW